MADNSVSIEARELALFGENDGDLYRQRTEPIILNLAKKMAAGTYDPDKAVILWKYWADDAAKRYEKDFGGKFSVAARKEAARIASDDFYDSVVDRAKSITVKRKPRKNPVARKPKTVKKSFTIVKWKREKNTLNGNPVYSFTLKSDDTGETFKGKTRPNAGFVYGLPALYEGDHVTAELSETPSGRVYADDIVKVGVRKNPVRPLKKKPCGCSSKKVGVRKNPIAKQWNVYARMNTHTGQGWRKVASFPKTDQGKKDAAEYAEAYYDRHDGNVAVKVSDD